jgi:type IV pilus assembly protein PilB
MTGKHAAGNAALLRYLVRTGLVPNDIAATAEAELAAQKDGATAIDWLVRNGIVAEDEVAEALAKALRLPFVNLAAVALDQAVTGLVREELATRFQIVPLRTEGQTLVVATANPLDRGGLRDLEFSTGKRIQIEVATQTAIRDALGHAYHLDDALNEYLRGVPDGNVLPVAELKEEPTTDLRNLMRETALPPVVKLLNLILVEGVRTHASDIHIEAGSTAVRVRYRIDGILEESLRLPKWIQDPLIARCKVLAKLDITERRVPQDGRIHIRFRESMVDLRVSSLPTQFGEKVTMRILDPSGVPTGLNRFNLSPRDLKCIRQAVTRPEGMILVTGPTGSGKTTTLYGMIAEIVSPTRNIVTIENPIEYQIAGVNQVEINEKQGLTFAETLRSILRQDPDVILVGEIRDAETAQIALRAAQTGHLVLSTLHTNDAVATISRLLDLGIESYMLASSLNLIIAQRLVRRICEACAEPNEPEAEALRTLQIEAVDQPFQRGRGCPACRKTGWAGRLGVFEVMPVSPALGKLIETKAPESALRLQARADGTKLLAEHAASRVCAGVTTAEEVLRVVDIAAAAPRCPACDRVVEENFAVCPHCATVLQCSCSSCNMRLQPEWQICPYCGSPAKHVAAAAAVASPPTAAPAAGAASRPTGEPRQYRALIVDDHEDMRRLIKFTLDHSELPLTTRDAPGGAEALEIAQDEPPDLILLDIMMPGMDGFQVCEQLRANVRTAFIPILMLTARDDPGSRARGFLAGTDDYVSKPFARAELLARVRRLLERTYGTILPKVAAAAPKLAPGPEPAPREPQRAALH